MISSRMDRAEDYSDVEADLDIDILRCLVESKVSCTRGRSMWQGELRSQLQGQRLSDCKYPDLLRSFVADFDVDCVHARWVLLEIGSSR